MAVIIRPASSADIPFLAEVVDDTKLFPSHMLPDMMQGALLAPVDGDFWLVGEIDAKIMSFCYAMPEKLTVGTWNMLAIGVHSSKQAKGLGTELVCHLEAKLRVRGGRLLIAETSGAPEFAKARHFYLKNGFRLEAIIRDFWSIGQDKIIFLKNLSLI